MTQGTQTGALWQPREVGWGGRWEGGSRGIGYIYIYIYLWVIHADVWQKPIQYCKAIILQLEIHFKKDLFFLELRKVQGLWVQVWESDPSLIPSLWPWLIIYLCEPQFSHLSSGDDDNTCLINATLRPFLHCLTYYKGSANVYYYPYSYYYSKSNDDDDDKHT